LSQQRDSAQEEVLKSVIDKTAFQVDIIETGSIVVVIITFRLQ